MKGRLPLLLYTLLALSSYSVWCKSATLQVLERFPLDDYYGVEYALRLGGDSLVFISQGGLYLWRDSTHECRTLIDRFPPDEQVPFSFCNSPQRSRLESPYGLWRVHWEGRDETLIYESFCSELLRVVASDGGRTRVTRWKEGKKGDDFTNFAVQDNVIVCLLRSDPRDKKLAIMKPGNEEYRKVFRCSESLVRLRDSVGLTHAGIAFCIPAYSPHDHTLWLAMPGYPYIYITDMNGELHDSLPIQSADYRRPSPLRSRIRSSAVLHEWGSHWTCINRFYYVAPGYFILQYMTETGDCPNDWAGINTKVVWDFKHNLVDMAIDPLWRIAGVQPDGRIVFRASDADSTGCKEVIVVARLEP